MLSDRETPDDADKVTMNGDAQANDLEAEFQAIFVAQRDDIKKHTKQTADLQDSRRKPEEIVVWRTSQIQDDRVMWGSIASFAPQANESDFVNIFCLY
ncbi:hypothetical protein NPIL_576851 [Nephila pilipes]|uniref:Uncharacterized protein n=1 Tax=Nephila pilipes TaxID=299642 RepID=A0A8X6NB69_NEPPI|nr:hypothetical protein NPIL_576851 [Nephila pilipes]